MTKTFKVLSALLSYPDEALQKAAPELANVLNEERLLPSESRPALEALIEEVARADVYDLQERYVELFDRTRSLSLHLFEHVHGESRDRGQAMIDLKNLYEQHGLSFSTSELPDYLPAFLEFLSTRPPRKRANFSVSPHISSPLWPSVWRSVMRPTRLCSGHSRRLRFRQPTPSRWKSCRKAPTPIPTTFAALDAQWEEEAVTFGPAAAPSCKDRLVAQIRAGRRPVADAPMKGEAP